MLRVILEASVLAKLDNPDGPVEVCDESGNMVGYFHPVYASGMGEKAVSPFSEEELLQRAQKPGGRTFDEILRDLDKLTLRMSYSAEICRTLRETLDRFVTLNPHQLAGHVANLDFWLAEVRHCSDVVEGHRDRFEAMKAAQMRYVDDKHTTEIHFDTVCECPDCSPRERAEPPKRIPKEQLMDSLRNLRDTTYRLLVRCYHAGFIDEARFRQSAESVGTGIDVSDLRR